MRAFLRWLFLLIALIGYITYRQWWDSYHGIAIAIVALLGCIIFGLRERNLTHQREEEGVEDSGGALGPILVGLMRSAILIGLLIAIMWLLDTRTTLAAYFYDTDRAQLTHDLNLLKEAHAWAEVEKRAKQRLELSISPNWRDELNRVVLEGIIRQGDGEADPVKKQNMYSKAVTWAQEHGLSAEEAKAKLQLAIPKPTNTPLPTYTPQPTFTPAPTYTPVPTYTPQPTAEAMNTPIPGTISCIAQQIDSVAPPPGAGFLVVLNACGNEPGLYQVDWYIGEGVAPYSRSIRVGDVARFVGTSSKSLEVRVDSSSGHPKLVLN